jgi:hypothetical protein
MKSPSKQDDARREDLRSGRMRSSTRRYEIKMSMNGYGERKDVPDARRVFKAILDAIVVVVSWRPRQTRISPPCHVPWLIAECIVRFQQSPTPSKHDLMTKGFLTFPSSSYIPASQKSIWFSR